MIKSWNEVTRIAAENYIKQSNGDPTGVSNPSLVLGYTDTKLTTVTKTINGVEYQKTLTYTGDTLTGVSSWVQL